MTTRIQGVRILQRKLSPMEADLRIVAEGEGLSGAELRGQVRGPMCPGVETVQISYPLRALPNSDQSDCLTARVLIPEPNLWTQETPFAYEATIELWRAGQCVDSSKSSFALALRNE